MLTLQHIPLKGFKRTRKKLYTIQAVYATTNIPLTPKLKEILNNCQGIGAKYNVKAVVCTNKNLHVKNYLENAIYPICTPETVGFNENTKILLVGTVGELWGVPLKKVLTQYTKADGSSLSPNDFKPNQVITLQSKPSNVCYAAFIPKSHQVTIQTAWGDVLIANRQGVPHGDGDFLVCNAGPDGLPALNDTWVVNGEVFPSTYAMNSFSNIDVYKIKNELDRRLVESYEDEKRRY